MIAERWWHYPARVGLMSLIPALIGSGYTAVVFTAATYLHAYRNNIRLTFEGTDYLDASIATLSFVSIFLALALYGVVYLAFSALTSYVLGISSLQKKLTKLGGPSLSEASETLSALVFGKFGKTSGTLLIIASSIIASFFVSLVFYAMLKVAVAVPEFGVIEPQFLAEHGASSFFAVAVPFISLVNMAIIRPTWKGAMSKSLATMFIVAIPLLLFNGYNYSALVKSFGYGGDREVSIVLRDSADLGCKLRVSGDLIIRTSQFFFVSTDDCSDAGRTPVELPVNDVRSVHYHLERGEQR